MLCVGVCCWGATCAVLLGFPLLLFESMCMCFVVVLLLLFCVVSLSCFIVSVAVLSCVVCCRVLVGCVGQQHTTSRTT